MEIISTEIGKMEDLLFLVCVPSISPGFIQYLLCTVLEALWGSHVQQYVLQQTAFHAIEIL